MWNFNLAVVDILFGNPTFEDTLNKLLFLGKQFIYKMKMDQSKSSLAGLRNIVWKHYKVENIFYRNGINIEAY